LFIESSASFNQVSNSIRLSSARFEKAENPERDVSFDTKPTLVHLPAPSDTGSARYKFPPGGCECGGIVVTVGQGTQQTASADGHRQNQRCAFGRGVTPSTFWHRPRLRTDSRTLR
jgi:hypothetical protein